MPDPDIEEALIAFEASKTAATPPGFRVVAKLRGYQARGNIGFANLPSNLYGESSDPTFLDNVRVNQGYRGDIGATSLVLAHEGVHRVINTWSIDEEIAAFDFQIDYFNELVAGVSYKSPSTGAIATARTSAATLGAPSETDRARTWRQTQQLVDFVLSKPKYHDLVTAPWVKANLGKWGGLRNRWATSLGLFVRALAKDGNSENAMQILDVLDVVSQQAHWTELLRVAGDFSQVRKSLRTFRNAPVAGRRMDNLAKKWQINWNAW